MENEKPNECAVVGTKDGPVSAWRKPDSFWDPDTKRRPTFSIVGSSPWGAWSAFMRDGRFAHGYTYPEGAPTVGRSAIRRAVSKLYVMEEAALEARHPVVAT
jgi:hypothetical protein